MLMFKVGDLARQIGVHRNTVTNWIKTGKLNAEATAAKKYLIPKEEFRVFCSLENIPDRTVQQIMAASENQTLAGESSEESSTPYLQNIRRDKQISRVNKQINRVNKQSILTQSFITKQPDNPIQREYFMTQKNLGSVMVVGGGIAGIQATLDLADSGYYVYLVEKSPGIGGAMAQLDKTFPTNDCAM